MLKKFGLTFIGVSIFSIGIIAGFSNFATAQHSPAHPSDKPGGKDVVKDEELDRKRLEEKEKSVEKYKTEGGKGVHKHNEEGEHTKADESHGISGRGESQGGAGIAGQGIVGGKETEKERRVEEAQKRSAEKEQGK